MEDVVEQLKEIIKTMSMEIRDLRDENESLWLMLDEIKASDEALKEQLDKSEQQAMIDFLASKTPIAEA